MYADDLMKQEKIRTEEITMDFTDEECRVHYREGFRRLAEILRAILCGTKKMKLQLRVESGHEYRRFRFMSRYDLS